MQRDAQVLDRMLYLCEDWARSLPQPQFADALGAALTAGTRIPERPEADKAPMLNEAEYAQQRQAQVRVLQLKHATSRCSNVIFSNLPSSMRASICA